MPILRWVVLRLPIALGLTAYQTANRIFERQSVMVSVLGRAGMVVGSVIFGVVLAAILWVIVIVFIWLVSLLARIAYWISHRR